MVCLRLQFKKMALLTVLAAASVTSFGGEMPQAAKPKTIGDLLATLKSTHAKPQDREAATQALGDIGDPAKERENRVTEELLDVVRNKGDNIFVRVAAIRALGRIEHNLTGGDHRAKLKYLKPFIALLADKDEYMPVKREVLEIFGLTLDKSGLEDQDAYKMVLGIAQNKADPNAGFRCLAIEVVGAYGDSGALDTLAAVMNEPDQIVKAAAVQAMQRLLEGIEQPALRVPTTNVLIKMLQDADAPWNIRISVMQVLAVLIRANNPAANAAMPTILKIAQTEGDDRVVRGAIDALGIVGSPEAIATLQQTYADYLKADTASPKKAEVRIAVINAFEPILEGQAGARVMDIRIVKDAATLLMKVVDDDPSDAAKIAAIMVMRYLYPRRFEVAQKEPVHQLLFLLREPDKDSKLVIPAEIKNAAVEALRVITGMDFGDDPRRWDDWYRNKRW